MKHLFYGFALSLILAWGITNIPQVYYNKGKVLAVKEFGSCNKSNKLPFIHVTSWSTKTRTQICNYKGDIHGL